MARVRPGFGFYGGRSSENARLLIDAATSLGYEPWVVATTQFGYIVPEDVLNLVNPPKGDDEDEAELAEGVEEEAVEPLKRPGKNDSKADWSAYVESLGVDIPEGATKDDLFALADEAEKEKN
jgi:hypothetical protein